MTGVKPLPEDVMKQIIEEGKAAKLQPGDITSEIAMDEWDISRNTALERLNKLVDEGVLEKIMYRTETKRRGWLFRPIIK